MSNSFTNQVLAQIELFKHGSKYKNEVYVLPKHLDEKVARLHLEARREAERADRRTGRYIGVPVEGPFKPAHYKY